jgi:hypothetical protein
MAIRSGRDDVSFTEDRWRSRGAGGVLEHIEEGRHIERCRTSSVASVSI